MTRKRRDMRKLSHRLLSSIARLRSTNLSLPFYLLCAALAAAATYFNGVFDIGTLSTSHLVHLGPVCNVILY